jgi:hypothetical protein
MSILKALIKFSIKHTVIFPTTHFINQCIYDVPIPMSSIKVPIKHLRNIYIYIYILLGNTSSNIYLYVDIKCGISSYLEIILIVLFFLGSQKQSGDTLPNSARTNLIYVFIVKLIQNYTQYKVLYVNCMNCYLAHSMDL